MEQDEASKRQLTELREQVEGSREALRALQEDRDSEKKSRVAFEMRLVEFEDYKKHVETDIVRSLNFTTIKIIDFT